MNSLEFKILKVAAHPVVRVSLALSWPVGAFVGVLTIVKYQNLFRATPVVSIASILYCFLGILVVTFLMHESSESGGSFRTYLTLIQLSSVGCFAYFSAACVTLVVLYRWTVWDNLRPQHFLPEPRLYPTANLAYLGLVVSLFFWVAAWWRKYKSLPI